MANQQIINYLLQNKDKYPVETLKAALIKNGFSPADVEEGVRQISGQGAPPPPAPAIEPSASGQPGPDAGAEAGDVVRYSPARMIANAIHMVKDPDDFFSRLDPSYPLGPAVLNVVLWSVAGACVSAVLSLAGLGMAPSKIAAAAGIIFVPIMAVIFSFVGAAIFHVLCKIMKGQAPYAGSYNALAGIIALSPVSSLLSAVPYAGILVQLYGLYLSVSAAAGIHKVAKKTAWIVFGILTAIGVLGMITAQRAAKRIQAEFAPMIQQAQQMQPMGQMQPGGQPLPTQQMPANAQNAMQAAQKMMGNMQQDPRFQQAMQQATAQSADILSDLGKYGTMKQPPAATLKLLNRRDQGRFKQLWPQLSAPIRKSLCETLPKTRPQDRWKVIQQSHQATQNMNQMLNQSMKMLQQLQQQQPQQDQGR